MFRGLLTVLATLVALIALVVCVIGFGLHRLAAAQRAEDALWKQPVAAGVSVASTAPSGNGPTRAVSDDDDALSLSAPIDLSARDAVRYGKVELVDRKGDPLPPEPPRGDRGGRKARMRAMMAAKQATCYLTGFLSPDDRAEWPIEVTKAGDYEINLTYSCSRSNDGGHFLVQVGARELNMTAESTRFETSFRVVTLGKTALSPGKTTLSIRPAAKMTGDRVFINLRSIQLIPVS